MENNIDISKIATHDEIKLIQFWCSVGMTNAKVAKMMYMNESNVRKIITAVGKLDIHIKRNFNFDELPETEEDYYMYNEEV